MRILKQPGEAGEPRRLAVDAEDGGQFRVVLPEGRDLLTDLTRMLVDKGISNAAVQLVGGSFASLEYLTGQPDHSGERVATYGAPTPLEGPVTVVGGNAILGRDGEGNPILHCHAVIIDNDGELHGGHLPKGVCVHRRAGGHRRPGQRPRWSRVSGVLRRRDELLDLPASGGGAMSDAAQSPEAIEAEVEAGRYGRLAVIRLKPNQDLIEGVESAISEIAMGHAVVRSAVGSLVDAALGYGTGEAAAVTSIEGPGIEILTLAGEIRPGPDGAPAADLRGTVSDPDANVYGGRFVRGANPICITLELVVQEWIPE